MMIAATLERDGTLIKQTGSARLPDAYCRGTSSLLGCFNVFTERHTMNK
ncbi:hypothetical protein AWB67_05815 [Caballeronia terrestris]|jgi:hypothetical protein|uniref:Uncharacterized protein n=2 Tax=Caballeronia TaxID=1827195 RepID=A0A158KKQ3_9BURK|nr:hypothetical protein AWB65_06964 [Caballeronia humi]SAL81323.1 hypothetical protein AWB67_05815 [Caballeronia terrestris]